MTKATSNALALMVLSLVLLNGYRLAPLLPGDLARSVFVLVCTTAGVACLVIGALRLVRSRSSGDRPR
jgi:hypothetical protein